MAEVRKKIEEAEVDFPLIVKPDIGERGFLVEIIENEDALKTYLDKVEVDLLVQELVKFPLEISVFYYRFPDVSKGKVTSVCLKKMLTVVGDGIATIAELMQAYPRANLQLERFQQNYPELLKEVPAVGQEVLLEPIGNHCRGTTFLNGNHHIDDQLTAIFDEIGRQMEGIYYGRFDMKCESIADLKAGKGFKILEFNGVAGEPAHIYDPSYPIGQAYIDIFQHWKVIYQISKVQRAKGIRPMSWKEAWQSIRNYRTYMSDAQESL